MRLMLGYGLHTFMANISLIVLNQDVPVLIGHFLTTTLVGYFSFPLRLLSYSVDLVTRLGLTHGGQDGRIDGPRGHRDDRADGHPGEPLLPAAVPAGGGLSEPPSATS